MPESRNKPTLDDFVAYCIDHPSERFWQALRNWSQYAFIYGSKGAQDSPLEDTFYKEGK